VFESVLSVPPANLDTRLFSVKGGRVLWYLQITPGSSQVELIEKLMVFSFCTYRKTYKVNCNNNTLFFNQIIELLFIDFKDILQNIQVQ